MRKHLQIENLGLIDIIHHQSERLRHILSQYASDEDQINMIGDYLFAIQFAAQWLEQNHKKVALYEKLRRMSPREFAELYARTMFGEGTFDELLAKNEADLEKWPE